MRVEKIAISIDPKLLEKIDAFVEDKVFKTRSHAIQTGVISIIERLEHKRLAAECEKLDMKQEQALADESLEGDSDTWSTF